MLGVASAVLLMPAAQLGTRLVVCLPYAKDQYESRLRAACSMEYSGALRLAGQPGMAGLSAANAQFTPLRQALGLLFNDRAVDVQWTSAS